MSTLTDDMRDKLRRVERHGKILCDRFNTNLDTTQGFQGTSDTSKARELAVRLYWLEEEAHKYSEWWCNGVDDSGNRYTMEHWTADCTPVLDKVYKLLGLKPLNWCTEQMPNPIDHEDIYDDSLMVWMNSDARGYTIKFSEEFTKKEVRSLPRKRGDTLSNSLPGIERDWGGYGIVGPEVIGETLEAENLGVLKQFYEEEDKKRFIDEKVMFISVV